MSITLFPSIQPQAEEVSAELPMYREVKWDFERDAPVFQNGQPIIVEGKEAVKVWAWNALTTPRFRYEIFTWDYGCEIEELIGQPFTEAIKKSEASGYVKECLLLNPYIKDVTNVSVDFFDSAMRIACSIETFYGEVNVYV